MFYDEFVYWCSQKGVSPTKAAADCSLSTGLPTAWKKRGLSPRIEIQQRLAEYFGITLDELNDHTKTYQTDTVDELRDELFEKRRILFDLSSKATEEDLDTMIRIFKGLIDD